MNWALLFEVWPWLALLAFVLVSCVLSVLAAQRRQALEIHNRILESRRLREAYLESVRNRVHSY